MPTITLTDEQASLIVFYLMMTTNYRKGEIQACYDLSQIKNEDGEVKFPNMKKDVIWWENTHRELEEIRRIIENALSTE